MIFVFLDYKRDKIDIKGILLNLEKKHLLKGGKFLKVGSRLIDSWIKAIPNPTSDKEIDLFQNELNSYQLEFEKYIDLYSNAVDHKSTLTEASERILLEQRSWIEQLRLKFNNPTIQENISGKILFLATSVNILCNAWSFLKQSQILLHACFQRKNVGLC